MPINTGMVGIRPVTPERPTREPDSIQRRGESTVSGFRPQTNVALRTAINDLAGTLGRIATSEKFGINKMPSDVSQVIRNILEQSLSLQETIGKGIGSTIESQRFSMDQLSAFGRMLFQLGSLMDRGFYMKISPETQTLLTQFKNLIVSSEGGNALEPVLMSKSAFELLDSKIPEQLPQAMYEILSQLSQPLTGAQLNQPQEDSNIMEFLNKLVKFFMPRPAADNRQPNQPQPQQQPQQNFQQPMNQQMPNQNFQQPMNQQLPQQNLQQPMNQQMPNQNFQQPMNQQMPQQNFQQPMNQQMPQQNFQQPMNQQMPNQNFQQPMNQQMPQQNLQQPMNQQMPNQNFQQPMNQQMPQQNFQQPMNQQMPQQNFQQPMNQQMPNQNFQQPMNQQMPQQNLQQPMNQQMPNQNFQQPMNQQMPQQNLQQPMNQQMPNQNFQQPMNQQMPNQNFQQPMNQQMPQQNLQQPMNQQMPNQNFQQPMNQQMPQQNLQQPMNQQMPNQNFQQPMNQQMPNQNFQQPMNQQMPQQNLQQPMNQQQPNQNFQQPMNQQMPQQNFHQPMNQQTPQQNFQQPMNQQTPQQNFQQPMNQQMTQQNFQQPMNQQMPQQNFQQPMNQQMPQQNFQQPMNQQTTNQDGQQQLSPEEFLKQQQFVRQEMKAAHNQIMKQPMLNTPQTLDTMKNLAQTLLRNPQLTQHETALLQNFINNPQKTLSNLERRHLQNLMRLCQQNVPVTVQQAAVQQKLPDLPRLWAFMQLCDMAKIASSNMTGRQLRRAGKDVADFANSMRSSMSNENFSTPVQNQRSFQLMVPVYLNVNEMSYPTYINVYEEKNGTNENGSEKRETWIRICVLTENIGAAELIFRVYDEDQLDMRFYFSQGETAGVFSTYVDELRESMKDIKLQIGEIRIGNVGSTMEQY